ncbi:3218_t:CDS:2 [Funneliformis geosporum]|uniref:6204_t:CDS:1 n=1 Tax=Funneliformis geosporum TaxID=1117311 RepID=A0A9W4SJT3_9GLOM|nr:6204_t:CDS:2 [Funneliformis geosporum]CAI2177379.1 3218_t:CDS:2 [Funneliformis geosporum]
MPSEHVRSSSNSSVTSPVPKINIVASQQKANSKDGVNSHGQSTINRGDLLEIVSKRTGQSKDKSARDKSPSRDRSLSRSKSPGRSKSSDKRGKSPSGRKSPSGDKLLGSPKSSRSRSPAPRSKSPNSKDSSSRSKSPNPNSRGRVGNDSMSRSSSQDARLNSGGKSQPWIAEKGGNSRNSNRLSLPPNFAELNINNAIRDIRESNERWAKLNLVPSDRDNKSSSIMGNFSKPSSLRMNMNFNSRPKLSVETLSNYFGSKSMQRTPSGGHTGNSNNSPLLAAAGGFPLMRSRSFNSAMDETQRLPASFLKELEKPHPLQHNWTMYYDSKPVMTPGPKTPTGSVSYEENLQTIGTFDTVETFCRYFNWVKKPGQLDLNTNFHIFKDKIKPMWEDPANANGGKWVISMRNTQLLDRCWTWLVYSLVGEELDENDDICGAVMSRRARGDRIAVWVRDKDNVPVINGIGRRLLKILDLQNEKGIGMDFQFNEDALKSGTSYNNRVYLSLESLKQELESEEKAKNEPANAEKRQTEVHTNVKGSEVDESKLEIGAVDVDAKLNAATRQDVENNLNDNNAKEEKPQTE